tara:strand:- start:612 stop:1247 length:636 start_codon:yes stop_codon:yes gene_type:complete
MIILIDKNTNKNLVMGGISFLSREQEKKKVFFQLGNRFGLPKELIIYLYNLLIDSIKHDTEIQINFHKNILSSHLCGPPYTIFDIDDEFFNQKDPFQYRLPIGKGNEWLIKSIVNRVDNIMYHGYYNQLKPRDIICQQIKIYGDYKFILRPRIIRCREYFESLEDMERIEFIDNMGIDLFDYYWDYLEDDGYNLICEGDTFRDEFFVFQED